MNCQNCGASLSCGCQKRVALNGKQCCNSCIMRCNQGLPLPSAPTKPAVPRQSNLPRPPQTLRP